MDAAIMIGFMMMSLMAVMAMHMTLINDIVPSLHEKMNYVPTFYFYNNGTMITGNEDLEEKEVRIKKSSRYDGNDKTLNEVIDEIRLEIIDLGQKKINAITINDIKRAEEIGKEITELEKELKELGYDPADPLVNLKLYDMFAFPAKIFFSGLLVFSLVVLLVERVNIGVQRGTAMKIFKLSIISLAVIYAVPEMWDPIAIELNDIGLYMLDPVDGKPGETVTKLWCRMGNVCVTDSRELLDEDLHKSLMANPNMGRDFFRRYYFRLNEGHYGINDGNDVFYLCHNKNCIYVDGYNHIAALVGFTFNSTCEKSNKCSTQFICWMLFCTAINVNYFIHRRTKPN